MSNLPAELADHIRDLGPDAVTKLMRPVGVLGAARVSRVTGEWMATPGSFSGRIGRLQLFYDRDAPSAPASVVAKFPSGDAGVRQFLGRIGCYAHEIAFYRGVAARSPLRVPCFYGAELSADGNRFVLLLEDCTPSRLGDQELGANRPDARAVVDALAVFHAAWWERADDAALRALRRLDRGADVPALYRSGWPEFDARFGTLLPPWLRAGGPRLDTRITALWRLMATPPLTVLHGDLRLDNLLFEGGAGDPRPIFVDWQATALGRGMFDLAYFCAGSLASHDIDVIEGLVHAYHDRLVVAGVRTYAWEACWTDFRAAVAWLWARTVIAGAHLAFAAGPARARFGTALSRWLDLADVCDAKAILVG